ncbi:hypothetical protein J31TS4_44220 [Paenibacillus sp. J31TS4]|uniref:hypothetical protein n=1 Tax=Paenibacillus sp. J31TS4 TaxID=2807195 RepID=UPI001B0FF356|nr:hypothetical protein [Paenibacillus sp. J31TS4]GIP41142.1 hypothetical protein J31TS4_44220 [Paenibacillus sp. J31TS4]
MPKLLLMLLLVGFLYSLHALQTDEEIAMHALFEAKHAMNRAAHAAAQQADRDKLAQGIPAVDPAAARQTAERYLRANLRLDASLAPEENAFLRERVELLVFEVIGESVSFPYVYSRPEYEFAAEFTRPGVVLIARIQFPRTFSVLGPIEWTVKSSAELVY